MINHYEIYIDNKLATATYTQVKFYKALNIILANYPRSSVKTNIPNIPSNQ